MVVRRRHLDHVDAGDRQLPADAPDGVQQLARREAARLGGAGARRVARVADVDVDRQEHRVAVVEGDLEGLVEAGASARGRPISVISKERIRCSAIHDSVSGPGQ